jgi:hypothetical protein
MSPQCRLALQLRTYRCKAGRRRKGPTTTVCTAEKRPAFSPSDRRKVGPDLPAQMNGRYRGSSAFPGKHNSAGRAASLSPPGSLSTPLRRRSGARRRMSVPAKSTNSSASRNSTQVRTKHDKIILLITGTSQFNRVGASNTLRLKQQHYRGDDKYCSKMITRPQSLPWPGTGSSQDEPLINGRKDWHLTSANQF